MFSVSMVVATGFFKFLLFKSLSVFKPFSARTGVPASAFACLRNSQPRQELAGKAVDDNGLKLRLQALNPDDAGQRPGSGERCSLTLKPTPSALVKKFPSHADTA